MKIASSGELQPISEFQPEFVARRADSTVIKRIFGAGVRRGDNVRDAVRDCTFGHCEGFFDGFCTIVETRQDVAVKVNHIK